LQEVVHRKKMKKDIKQNMPERGRGKVTDSRAPDEKVSQRSG